jgi:hypothetical protein
VIHLPLLVLALLPLILLAAILASERKRRWTRTYLEIAKAETSNPDAQREALRLLEEHTRGSSLRRGVFGTVFGIVLLVIPAVMRGFMMAIPAELYAPSPVPLLPFAYTSGLMGLALLTGVVVLGYGIANLAVWFFADRRREERVS